MDALDQINEWVAKAAQAEFAEATGLVVRTHDPVEGFTQVIGPFRKDTVTAFEMQALLKSEQEENPSVQVTVEFLYDPSMGEKR